MSKHWRKNPKQRVLRNRAKGSGNQGRVYKQSTANRSKGFFEYEDDDGLYDTPHIETKRVSYEDLRDNKWLRLLFNAHARYHYGKAPPFFYNKTRTVKYQLEAPIYRFGNALNRYKSYYFGDLKAITLDKDISIYEATGFQLSRNGAFECKKLQFHNIPSFGKLKASSADLIKKLLENNRFKDKLDHKLGYEHEGVVNIFSNSVLKAKYLKQGGCYFVMPRKNNKNKRGSYGVVKEPKYIFVDNHKGIYKLRKRNVAKIINFAEDINEALVEKKWRTMNSYLEGRHTDDQLFQCLVRTNKKGEKKAYLFQSHGGDDLTVKRYDLQTQARYMLAVAKDLKYMHEQEMKKHNDIKPENILEKNGIIKLVDFGLAQDIKSNGLGTTFYSSPEQFMHGNNIKAKVSDKKKNIIDHEIKPLGKTDVFSLGMTWLYLILRTMSKDVLSLGYIARYEQMVRDVRTACEYARACSDFKSNYYDKLRDGIQMKIERSHKYLKKIILHAVTKAVKHDGTISEKSQSQKDLIKLLLDLTKPYYFNRPNISKVITKIESLLKQIDMQQRVDNSTIIIL